MTVPPSCPTEIDILFRAQVPCFIFNMAPICRPFFLHLNGKPSAPRVLPISLAVQSPMHPGGASGFHQHLDKAVLRLSMSFQQLGLGHSTPHHTRGLLSGMLGTQVRVGAAGSLPGNSIVVFSGVSLPAPAHLSSLSGLTNTSDRSTGPRQLDQMGVLP